jgi:hypothetical protein
MAIVFPTPAQALLQNPVNTFSSKSTPLTNTYNGGTYYYDALLNQWSTTSGPGLYVTAPTTQASPGVTVQLSFDSAYFYWYDGAAWQRAAADPTPW